jgi:hypothetical protein
MQKQKNSRQTSHEKREVDASRLSPHTLSFFSPSLPTPKFSSGGIAVTLVGHPFDTVKVRLQTQPSVNPVYCEKYR